MRKHSTKAAFVSILYKLMRTLLLQDYTTYNLQQSKMTAKLPAYIMADLYV